MGTSEENHDCRSNFDRSAKAMEADAAVELVCNSQVLNEANCRVKVLIGDEDQWAIADVRKERQRQGIRDEILKLADQNHVKKNFSKKLYKLKKTTS